MQAEDFPVRAVLSQNLQALLESKVGPSSQMALAKRSGVAQATLGRILRKEVAASIETVHAIAHAYQLEAWQLLVAGMAPDNPPVLRAASKHEQELYDRLRIAAQELAKIAK